MSAFRRGALDGLEERLEAAIRTLVLMGADAKAAFSRVYLARVRYARGETDLARTSLDEALRVLRSKDLVLGLVDALNELGHLQAIMGRLSTAGSLLEESTRTARGADDHSGVLSALAESIQYHCFVGDRVAAIAVVNEAAVMAQEKSDPSSRAHLGLLVAEAVLFGLPREALTTTADAIRSSDDATEMARAALDGALALSGSAEHHLQDGFVALRSPRVGLRHAELQIAGDLFEVEFHAREGRASEAGALARRAAADARALNHVWLELAALTRIRRFGGWDHQTRDRARTLLSTLRATAPSAAQAARIDKAWSP